MLCGNSRFYVAQSPKQGRRHFRTETFLHHNKPMKNTSSIFNSILPLRGSGKATIPLAALLALLSTVNSQLSTAHAQGTGFTYQGHLANGGNPVTGLYDFTNALYNASSGGAQVGSTITLTAVPVTNGLFTVLLDFDGVFNGTAYWLQIGVRSNGVGSYVALSPRQQLTPTPYAVTAENLDGTVLASQLSGTLPSGLLSGTCTGRGDTEQRQRQL